MESSSSKCQHTNDCINRMEVVFTNKVTKSYESTTIIHTIPLSKSFQSDLPSVSRVDLPTLDLPTKATCGDSLSSSNVGSGQTVARMFGVQICTGPKESNYSKHKKSYDFLAAALHILPTYLDNKPKNAQLLVIMVEVNLNRQIDFMRVNFHKISSQVPGPLIL